MSDLDLFACTLLVVDDEPANLELLEAFLTAEGYGRVVCHADPRRALATLPELDPDLVLLDLHMPHLGGLEVLAAIRERSAPGEAPPVLVLTADVTAAARDGALLAGARDFVTKPFDAAEVLLRVRNLLETRVLHRRERDARRRAEEAAARAALLADASRSLGSSLDGATAACHLAARLAPVLGEACVVLRATGGGLEPLAVAPTGAAATEMAAALAADPGVLAAAGGTDPTEVAVPYGAALVAPLRTHGEPLGALALLRGGARGWTNGERELAAEIAGRAGLALDNARLFAAAESARRARERMLAVVAHDLRNPLAAIVLNSEMLLSMQPEGESDAYEAGAVRSIFRSAERMQGLIEDLLDDSSLQQGAFPLRRREQPIRPILQEAEEMLRPLADERGVALVLVAAPEVERVDVDASRLLQVISNLVGNAVKHTSVGGTIEVRVGAADDGFEVRVADSGSGIPDEQIPHLFDAFQKGRGERRGVGLGLWIARAIVEAHGGRIWAEPNPGGGAVLRFQIPDTAVAARAAARLWVD